MKTKNHAIIFIFSALLLSSLFLASCDPPTEFYIKEIARLQKENSLLKRQNEAALENRDFLVKKAELDRKLLESKSILEAYKSGNYGNQIVASSNLSNAEYERIIADLETEVAKTHEARQKIEEHLKNQIEKQYKTATYIFNAPDDVFLGLPFIIKLKISANKSKLILEKEFQEAIDDGGLTGNIISKEFEILLPPDNYLITATLESGLENENFIIELQGNKNPKRNFDDGEATWMWYVSANKKGPHILTLLIQAEEKGKDGVSPKHLLDKVHKINVHVTNQQMLRQVILSQEWQWLWGAIVLPILGGLWWLLQWLYRRWKTT